MTKAKVNGSASDYILPLGIIGLLGVGAYFLFDKFFPGAGGTNPGINQGNEATGSAVQQGTAATAQQQAAKGEVQTISPVQAAAIANSVYSIGESGSAVDCMAIKNQIVNVNNLTDLNAVITAFGTRSAATGGGWDCSLLGLNCSKVDFPTYVRLVLTTSCNDSLTSSDPNYYLNDINSYLSATGINFQF